MSRWLFLYLLIGLLPSTCMATDKHMPPTGEQLLYIFFQKH